jgi:thiosulfate/3-mercaptopyruvate sulfurtransferase
MINHDHGNLAIFNATLKRGDIDPVKDHVKSRIKHSILFDFEQFCLKGTELPYMLPSEEQFCELMKQLDVRKSDHIVVYDQAGMLSAPRAFWMLKTFGAPHVMLLNGT